MANAEDIESKLRSTSLWGHAANKLPTSRRDDNKNWDGFWGSSTVVAIFLRIKNDSDSFGRKKRKAIFLTFYMCNSLLSLPYYIR